MSEDQKRPANNPSSDSSVSGQSGKGKESGGKPSAADRIKERLQKKIVKQEQQESQNTIEESAAKPEAEKPSYELMLSDELAKIWEGLQLKSFSEDDVINAFLNKSKMEKEGKNVNLLDLIQERRWLPPKDYEKLKLVTAKKIKIEGKPPKATAMDLRLAHTIMEYKLLEREEMQRMLRVQTALHQIGLRNSLQSILVVSKLVPEDVISSLLSQSQKEVEEKKAEQNVVEDRTVSTKAIVSQETRRYPVLKVLVLLCVMFILLFVWIYLSVLFKKPVVVVEKKKPVSFIPVKYVKNPKDSKDPEKPKEVSRTPNRQENQEKVEEMTEAQMRARGLFAWGSHWITEQQRIDLEKNWKPGAKPSSISFSLMIDRVSYLVRERKPGLIVQGQFGMTGFPEKTDFILPPEMQLKMEMTLFSWQKENASYGSKNFIIDSTKAFQIILAPLPKPLITGVYFLRLSLVPDIQSEFLKDFLSLTSTQEWWICFSVGEQIQEYIQFRGKEIEEIQKTLSVQFENWKKVSGQRVSKEKWDQFSKKFTEDILTIRKKLEQYSEQAMIPLWPDVDARVMEAILLLDTLFKELEEWQIGLIPDPPNFVELEAKFHIIESEIRITLHYRYEELVKLLKTEKIVRTE